MGPWVESSTRHEGQPSVGGPCCRHILLQIWRELRDDSGQTIILTALSIIVVLILAGIAVDVGYFRYAEGHLRTAADAAALSGALELSACQGSSNCGTMQTAAQRALVENGLNSSTLLTQCAPRSGGSVTLILNNGPCYLGSSAGDPNYGNTNFVEAVLTAPVRTYFMKIVGIDSINETVRAEATVGNSPNCLFTHSDTMNSGSQLSASCGVTTGDLMVNGGSHMAASQISYYGTYTSNGGSPSPTPVHTNIQYTDPLSWVQPPPVGACSNVNPVSSNVTMSAGTYCGININSGTLTLNPGTYVMSGSINVGSGATIQGSGVTIYFSSGTFQLNSGSNVNLVAPTTGPYAGILIYQAASDTQNFVLDSGSGSTWQGALYLPGAGIEINSGGNAAAYTIIDADSVIVDSGAKFNLGNNYSSLPGGSPAKSDTAILVE